MHRILPVPVRFRLTDPADVEKHGADWTVYDEAQIIRAPSARLIAFEKATGMSIKRMTIGLREEFTEATRVAMWIARQMAGFEEEFEDFDPIILLADWQRVPEDGDDADPPASSSSGSTES
jgi:hypothetical protein